MTVQWIQDQPPQQLGLAPNVGLGAGVSVATSGIVPAALVLGVLGLAFYGFGVAMQRRRRRA